MILDNPLAVPEAVEEVRSAGIGRISTDLIHAVPTLRDEDWQAAFETIFLGTVRAARAVAQQLRQGAAARDTGVVDRNCAQHPHHPTPR